jgi:hypothetical protein
LNGSSTHSNRRIAAEYIAPFSEKFGISCDGVNGFIFVQYSIHIIIPISAVSTDAMKRKLITFFQSFRLHILSHAINRIIPTCASKSTLPDNDNQKRNSICFTIAVVTSGIKNMIGSQDSHPTTNQCALLKVFLIQT